MESANYIRKKNMGPVETVFGNIWGTWWENFFPRSPSSRIALSRLLFKANVGKKNLNSIRSATSFFHCHPTLSLGKGQAVIVAQTESWGMWRVRPWQRWITMAYTSREKKLRLAHIFHSLNYFLNATCVSGTVWSSGNAETQTKSALLEHGQVTVALRGLVHSFIKSG